LKHTDSQRRTGIILSGLEAN